MKSKLTAALTAAALTLTSAAGSISAVIGNTAQTAIAAAPAKTDKDVNADGSYNYGSALQKSMYF